MHTLYDERLSHRQSRQLAQHLRLAGWTISALKIRELGTLNAVAQYLEPEDTARRLALRDGLAAYLDFRPSLV